MSACCIPCWLHCIIIYDVTCYLKHNHDAIPMQHALLGLTLTSAFLDANAASILPCMLSESGLLAQTVAQLQAAYLKPVCGSVPGH